MFFRKKVGPEYYYERGEECLRSGSYQWAVESFTRAVEFDRGLEMAYYRRAEAYKKLGKTREAALDYIRFLETDARQPDGVDDLSGVLKEAFNVARMGWERDSAKEEIIAFGVPTLLDTLMEEYDPREEYADQRFYRLAQSWLEEQPVRDARRIGFVQLLRGKLDEAVEELERGVKDHPDDPGLYYLMGVALLGVKGREEGRRSLFKLGESAEELSVRLRACFEEAVRRDGGLRLCPGCGHRARQRISFCMYCGGRLLSADDLSI